MLPGALLFRLRNLQSSIRLGEVAAEDLAEELPTKIEAEPFWASLGQLLLPFIPLILFAHLVLALVKLNAIGQFEELRSMRSRQGTVRVDRFFSPISPPER